MKHRKFLALSLAVSLSLLTGCRPDSEIVSQNLSLEADSFNVPRRIVFYNSITGDYVATMTGYCSIKDADNLANTISVICKTRDGYKKSYMHLSDNVTYVSDQLAPSQVSPMQYELLFKPSTIVPTIDVQLHPAGAR